MRRAALAATILTLAACPAAFALGAEVSRDDLAQLADAAASGDPRAEAQLRAVTSVDGTPVDVDRALQGASTGEEERDRLEELAASARAEPLTPALDSGAARGRADQIAGGDASPVETSSGDGGGIELPSIPFGLGIAAAAVALVAGLLIARAVARRRVIEAHAAKPEREPRGGGPRDLERAAGDAESRGDYAAAIRLRFRAGLERLDAAGAVRLRPALTANGAARELGSSRLAELAGSYDEIVFGARPAESADAQAARSGWAEVLSGVRV